MLERCCKCMTEETCRHLDFNLYYHQSDTLYFNISSVSDWNMVFWFPSEGGASAYRREHDDQELLPLELLHWSHLDVGQTSLPQQHADLLALQTDENKGAVGPGGDRTIRDPNIRTHKNTSVRRVLLVSCTERWSRCLWASVDCRTS